MNALKRYLGILWIVLGIITPGYLIRTGINEMAHNPATSTKVQWSIFIIIFIPIAIGLVLFGYYALKGEYEK